VDIGLTHRVLNASLSSLFKERGSLMQANRGGLAEQFVAQELLSYTPKNKSLELNYWHREAKSSQAEVDFVVERDGCILPIEVKSGKGGSMKSLHLFMKEKKKWVREAIKISEAPFSKLEKIEGIPFYAIKKLSYN
jgi:predicted AAA+ superfamily ATPase